MPGSLLRLDFARRHPGFGTLLLRGFLGFVLVWGTADNVFDSGRMLEFGDFLAANGFPAPLAAARLSAYGQFIAGAFILLGAFTRQAALAMMIHFAVALAMVHVGLPFNENIAPLAMFFGCAALLFHGGGSWSVDALREDRARSARLDPIRRAARA